MVQIVTIAIQTDVYPKLISLPGSGRGARGNQRNGFVLHTLLFMTQIIYLAARNEYSYRRTKNYRSHP